MRLAATLSFTRIHRAPTTSPSSNRLADTLENGSGEVLMAARVVVLATWLLAAGGRPDEALALARLGLSTSAWAELPRSVARGDWSALADWAPARQLDLLHKICHDLMVVASGGLPRFFPPADLPPPPRDRKSVV